MSQYIRLRRSFALKERLNIKELYSIERSLNEAGITIKIETVADGIIIFHKATTDFAKNLRTSLAPFVTFADEKKLPSSYAEIVNLMSHELIFTAADNEQYIAICQRDPYVGKEYERS